MTDTPKRGFRTRLSHTGRAGKRVHGFVNPPLQRGSTVLYPTVAERRAMAARRGERVLTYGLGGSETHWALEDVIAEVEGGTRCAIVCSGLAAVTTPLLAFLKTGDHCLMPDSVYGPARNFADGVLKRYGVATTFYDPVIDESGIADLMRPNTTVVYTESPGSHTFEVQDIPAIARAAHARGAKVLMDNTWGIHHFQPFKHGVDVSIQAATKYPAGHSDILIGSVTVNSDRGLAHAACDVARAGSVCQPGRLLADAAWHAHAGRAAGAADGQRHRGGALAEQAAGGEAGAASGAAGCAGSRDLEARLFRCVQPVRRGVQARVFGGEHARVRRGARPVRHRRVMGRVRESGVADDGFPDAVRREAPGSMDRWCGCISGWRMSRT